MSTINDLSVIASVSSDDKIPLWQNANGVTRGLPVSVFDSRYLTQDAIALLAASANVETFSATVNFTPGVTFSLTLANLYYSAANIEVFFDGTFQGPDQYSLIGYGLTFISPIPVGVQNVYVRGGAVRVIGAPSAGTVTDASLAPGSKIYNRGNDKVSVTDWGANQVLDASAAFILAANACNARGGGTVSIPAGTWKLSTTIPSYKNVEFVGDGEFSTILQPTTAGMTLFSCINGALTITYNAFRNFTVQPTVANVTGIALTLCRWAIVENVNFAGCATNVVADRGYFIDLLNITSEGVTGLPAGAVVMSSTVDNDYIYHSTISNYKLVNQGTGVPQVGIYMRRAIDFQLTDIHAYGAAGSDILIVENDSQAVKVKGLNVDSCTAGVILRQGAGVSVFPSFTSIASSHIDQATAVGIQLNGATNTTLNDVMFTPNVAFTTIPALAINNATQTIVNACQFSNFTGAGGAGIQLSGSDTTTIDNNIFLGCNIGIGFSGTPTNTVVGSGNQYQSCPNPIGGVPTGSGNRIAPNQRGLVPSTTYVPVAPTFPASTVPFTNNTGFSARVSIAGGAFTIVTLNGINIGVTGNTWSGDVLPGETIAVTYTSVPGWWWVGK